MPEPTSHNSDHHLNRFADKSIERTVSIQPSGYLGRNHRRSDADRNWHWQRETGARTRNFNLGKVGVRFCIQAHLLNLSGYLSTPIFERDHAGFANHHRPIKWSGR